MLAPAPSVTYTPSQKLLLLLLFTLTLLACHVSTWYHRNPHVLAMSCAGDSPVQWMSRAFPPCLQRCLSDSFNHLGSLNCSMPAASVHFHVQVNVAIMLAPVAFLGHITSQPVEAMARMETDKVSIHNSLLQKLVRCSVQSPQQAASSSCVVIL